MCFIDLNRDQLLQIVDRFFTKELTSDDANKFFEIVKANQVSYKE